jgi:hypothetical protein
MVAMPRPRILVLVPMLVALAVGVSAVPAGATSWGTAPRVSASSALPPELVAVRVGRHQGFDRVVLELRGSPPGYNVRYVPQVVQDGSGRPVPLAGSAFIQVVLNANAHELDTGAPTWTGPQRISAGFPALKQVAFAGDFEGYVTFGLGLGQRTGFRVLALRDPSRIVVDVAHPTQAGAAGGSGQSSAGNGSGQSGSAQGANGQGAGAQGANGQGAAGSASGQGDAGVGADRATGGQLPFTGLPVLALLGAGVGGLGIGVALFARQRRRRGLPAA